MNSESEQTPLSDQPQLGDRKMPATLVPDFEVELLNGHAYCVVDETMPDDRFWNLTGAGDFQKLIALIMEKDKTGACCGLIYRKSERFFGWLSSRRDVDLAREALEKCSFFFVGNLKSLNDLLDPWRIVPREGSTKPSLVAKWAVLNAIEVPKTEPDFKVEILKRPVLIYVNATVPDGHIGDRSFSHNDEFEPFQADAKQHRWFFFYDDLGKFPNVWEKLDDEDLDVWIGNLNTLNQLVARFGLKPLGQ